MNTLSKTSTNSEIKDYFSAVLKLTQSNEAYPVNLDEVWPLVYSEKSKAVRALRDNFIENVDYKPVAQNGKRSEDGKFSGGDRIDYHLSVSCMEFFIARKVRPVFEVYRQVFHKTAERTQVLKAPTVRRNPQRSEGGRFAGKNKIGLFSRRKTLIEPVSDVAMSWVILDNYLILTNGHF